MWSLEFGVGVSSLKWSVKCGVGSGDSGAESVECGV